jgi:phage-related minor tail protein
VNNIDTLTFRVTIDDSGVASTSNRTTKAIGDMAAAASAGQKQFAGLAVSAGQTRAAFAQLPAQFTDIATQLAGGQNPFLILLQQGGQIKDSFGGLGNTFRALGSVITPVRLLVGGLGASFAAAGLAAYQGYKQTEEFNRSLQLTGNYAGITAGKFNSMAQSLSQSSRATIGDTRELLQALVSTGQVGPGAFAAVSQAATTLMAASGRSADEVVKDFASMSSGVAKWAAEHNRAYNYLTAEQYKYIRSLEAAGRTEEAMRVNAEALTKALKDRQPQLGYLQKSWEGVAKFASAAWDAMLGIGRAETLDDQLAKLNAQIKALQPRSSSGSLNTRDAQVLGDLTAQRENLQARIQLANVAAQAQAKVAAAEQKKIEESSKTHQGALLDIERSGLNLRAAQAEAARERQGIEDKRALDALELTSTAYMNRRIARENAAINAKEAAINAEIELERRRVSEKPGDELGKQQRILDLETKRVAVQIERARLADKAARGELFTAGPAQQETAQQQFLRFERAQQAEVEKAIQDRSQASAAAVSELIETNRAGSIALIRDEQQRGLALIEEDERTIRRRLDLATMSVNDRQMAEEALAQWRVQREAQLTEELKPEWQRQLDAWRDTTRLMRDSFNEFQTGWLREGENAWVQFMQTGKISATSLVNFVLAEFARLQFRQALAPAFSGLGQGLASLLGLGGSSGVATGTAALNPAQFALLKSANGNVFGSAGLQAFAKGGILGAAGGLLTRPTVFPMANGGVGLGGEAGTEAVMPLRRTASGKLGVISQGSGPAPQVNVAIYGAPSQPTVRQKPNGQGGVDIEVMFEAMRDRLVGDVQSGGKFGAAMQNQYGVNRAQGLVR